VVIELDGLSKRYGATLAVDDLTVSVRRGLVTGFLGPNGAGKSTTLRMLLGLTRPTAGTALIDGVPYAQLAQPGRMVGALLDAAAVQPYRSAAEHLRWIATAARIDQGQIGRTLELVGLAAAADRRIGDFSLGMRQRLGLAAALLGDPEVLILDEPSNGLDPEGIAWLRRLLRSLAAEGRTVLVSSHLMAEMEQTADRVVILNAGRFLADLTIPELTARTAGDRVCVSTPSSAALRRLLLDRGATVVGDQELLTVTGLPASSVGDLASAHGIVLHELRPERVTLEEAFLQLTGEPERGRRGAAAALPVSTTGQEQP
jgi:ABC-2 type transport system ATP-binding protein